MEESATTQRWFLRKHEDGTIFGPLSFELLARWASNAQLAPHDTVSTDQQTWIKAPMLPELGMDWLVETGSKHRCCRSWAWIGWSKSRANIITGRPLWAPSRSSSASVTSTKESSWTILAVQQTG